MFSSSIFLFVGEIVWKKNNSFLVEGCNPIHPGKVLLCANMAFKALLVLATLLARADGKFDFFLFLYFVLLKIFIVFTILLFFISFFVWTSTIIYY